LNDFSAIEKAEKIVEGYKNPPTIFHDQQDRNFYSPPSDEVHLTTPEQFISNEEYYSTTFHELVHSTGHSSRLNRGNDTRNRNSNNELQEYSREELVAEIGSTYLCGIAGIDRDAVIKNSAGYIQSWKKKLEENTDWIVWAGTRASKACDHILGTEYGK
jgi:antirestriction protein ArdC